MTPASGTDVVVTAMAAQTCLGGDLDTLWDGLRSGRSGVAPVAALADTDIPCRIGGEVREFDARARLTATDIRRTTLAHQLLHAVTTDVAAGPGAGPAPGERGGLAVGTGAAGTSHLSGYYESHLDALVARGWRSIERLTLPKVLPSMPAAFAAERLGWTGPCHTLTSACAASTDAVGLARQWLRTGFVDVAIAAGVETVLTRYVVGAFAKLQALTSRPPEEAERASRPFDRHRDGMVPADGAAALLLETRSRAESRGAEPLAVVAGYGSTTDAHHMLEPRSDGRVAASAIGDALADAGVGTGDIDLVCAHGTSTVLNDRAEARALALALGAHVTEVAVTAPKSMLGHALGASGVIEIVATILALRHRTVPPTINLDDPDDDVGLDHVADKCRPADVELALKCSFGFGGHNAAVVLRRTA